MGAGKGVWDAKEGKRKVGRTGKEEEMPALDVAVAVGVTFIRAGRVRAKQRALQQWKCEAGNYRALHESPGLIAEQRAVQGRALPSPAQGSGSIPEPRAAQGRALPSPTRTTDKI